MQHQLTKQQEQELAQPLALLGIGVASVKALAEVDVLTVADLLNVPYPDIANVPGVDAEDVCTCVREFCNRHDWRAGDTFLDAH